MSKNITKKQAKEEASKCKTWVKVEDEEKGFVYGVQTNEGYTALIPSTWFEFDALGKGKLRKEYERHVKPFKYIEEKQ